jgi:hypothetical protein
LPFLLTIAAADATGTLPAFDFAQPAGAEGWQAAHDINQVQSTADGLLIQISGPDPYIHGPARDYPANTSLWLSLRLKSDQAGTGQVFFFRTASTEADSVQFPVPGGQWFESRIRLPALGPGYRLRFDPPGNRGSCLLAWLCFEERLSIQAPVWPKPVAPAIRPNAVAIESGELRLIHNQDALGGFAVEVAGQYVAVGHTQPVLGYLSDRQVRWLPLGINSTNRPVVQLVSGILKVNSVFTDADGARWERQEHYSRGTTPGAINLEIRVTANQARAVAYLPMFMLLPGLMTDVDSPAGAPPNTGAAGDRPGISATPERGNLGAYGTNKTQGLFAGVEYLDNEPSSSEADVIGSASKRQVPDSLKVTWPLMAIAANDRYVGLIWAPRPELSAVFDSPDRLFGSGGHLMGILFPGSNGTSRDESSLLPHECQWIRASQPIILRATLIGGLGMSVAPAIQQYVQLRGLLPVPSPELSARDYFRLAAKGWLDSKIREGNLYRHAFWPGFGPHPAADAAMFMDWLAGKVGEEDLARRLTNAAQLALGQVPVANLNISAVGHVRYPAPALIYGSVAENAVQAKVHGRNLMDRFEPDGSVLYRASPVGQNYGKTHFARDANGLTAQVVVSLLEAAIFSGDRALINNALRQLRALDKFRYTVPRGAQTWEIPLHTPDILASAHLVRAYTLGYELTGDQDLLDQARYWAWTGVPFVYLYPPTSQPIGLYNTIPVLGATGWKAPLWIGLPVQWCGLVYADALYWFARHDPVGPWQQIADGISLAGVQHTWPLTDPERQGLLPDVFQLRAQRREGPAINPATVLACATRRLGGGAVYDFRACRPGFLIHAPGQIALIYERTEGVKFTVTGWSARPYWVLVNGIWRPPQVKVNGQEIQLLMPHQYLAEEGRLILQLRDRPEVEIVVK